MAVDYFLKIDSIDGEATDEKHKGELHIESFSFGVSQMGTSGHGGGLGGGKANFQDFNFVLKNEKASPKLLLACATGQHIKSAVLTARKAGGKQEDYLKYTFSDLLISSYQTGGSSSGEEGPMDQCSFNYVKLETEYRAQKSDGTLEGPVKAGYDLKKNVKV